MTSFEILLSKVGKEYLLTEQDLGIPQGPQDGSAIDAAKQQVPQEQPQTEQPPQDSDVETKKLTVEGKRFLIELALKALAINPEQLSESDKAIFNDEVTPDNAEKVLNQIQAIIDQNS